MSRVNRKLTYAPLQPVAPADIGRYWPMVRRGLDYLAQFGGDWGPEHIYHALMTADCVLMVGTGDDGFLVVSQRQDWLGKILWIWVAYGAHDADIPKYWRDLKKIAKAAGATRMMFSSPIKAWERRARHYGFRKAAMIPYVINI